MSNTTSATCGSGSAYASGAPNIIPSVQWVKPSSDKVFTVHEELRIALIGKTGAGKSASGNAIVGGKAFVSKSSGFSVTKVCQIAKAVRGDKKIILVDTPGLFDTDLSIDAAKTEIAKCVAISSPGVHCFLVVIDASKRFTKEETETVNHILQMFGENSHRYLVVLFTRIDQLEEDLSDEENFLGYLNDIPKGLEEFLQKCDKRCTWINNRAVAEMKEVQVVKLLGMIEDMLKRNGGNCYTSELYEQTEHRIKEAIDQAREKEIREAEKEKEKLLKKIKKEQKKISKEKLKEEMIKLQKEQEEKKLRQEEEIRTKIRDDAQKSNFAIFGDIFDLAAEFLFDKLKKLFKKH